MIFIKPVNRMLLVKREPIPEKKNNLGIILPESSTKVEKNVIVELIAAEEASMYRKYESQKILVHAAMLEDFELKGTRVTIVPENGVIAIISESELF